jgi:hypothetical protein
MTTRELYDSYLAARITTQRADLECSEAWRRLCRYGHIGCGSDARLQREYDEAATRRRDAERREDESYQQYHAAVNRERQRSGATPQGV